MKSFRHLVFTWTALLLWAGAAQAELTIQITGGTEGALPIAVVPFHFEGAGTPPHDVAEIIRSDLARSGRFAPQNTERLPARPYEANQVDYSVWRSRNIDNLVVGRIQAAPGGGYQVRFQLLGVYRGTQLAGYSISASAENLRRIAHQISDIVYQTLLGERGAFDTHIAYVTVTKAADGEKTYRLAIADSDGHNEQIIYESTQPVMSPAWSPDGQRLAYVSFSRGRPEIYIQNLASGQSERISDFPGLNGAPIWSPDGGRLALTLSKDGSANVYLMDVATRKLTQITDSYAIDTEPAWLPDGRSLIFTSDRGGRPQLYRVAVGPRGASGAPRRITFEGNYNAGAAVSPDGSRVAMVHSDGGGFRIAVQDLEKGDFQVLTDTRLDESPSFAPNGSMIIYATQTGGSGVLSVVSVDGRAHHKLALQRGDVREPTWSPFRN